MLARHPPLGSFGSQSFELDWRAGLTLGITGDICSHDDTTVTSTMRFPLPGSSTLPAILTSSGFSAALVRRHLVRGVMTCLLVATMGLAATPARALFMTPLPEYEQMSREQQIEIVTTTVFEMIYYFNNVKHDNQKANCVGEYFSGSVDDRDGGYYHFSQRLDDLRERYASGAVEKPEDLYVERIILKLIKEKCGV